MDGHVEETQSPAFSSKWLSAGCDENKSQAHFVMEYAAFGAKFTFQKQTLLEKVDGIQPNVQHIAKERAFPEVFSHSFLLLFFFFT